MRHFLLKLLIGVLSMALWMPALAAADNFRRDVYEAYRESQRAMMSADEEQVRAEMFNARYEVCDESHNCAPSHTSDEAMARIFTTPVWV